MADRSVKIVLSAKVDGLQAGLRTATKAVSDFSSRSGKWFDHNRQQLDQIAGASTRVGLGLVAASGFAVKAAMDWETAWTGVLKTVDGTSKQLGDLEDDLRDLAKETGFAHAEVAAVAEAAGQLGISTPGIASFTETMLAMGVSTNLSAEEAATGLARFRNIMGSTESEVLNMGSTIVGLGNNFATTEAEILAMSLRIAGAGRQAGLSESDVMGLSAAMSSVGIEAEAGGTAMSLTMKRIGKEVDANGPKLDTFARIAGVSADSFSKAWKDDAAGALTAFVAGLDDAGQSGESVNAILSELGITGIREADALLRLSGNAEGLAEALAMGNAEWAQNNALMAEADKFYGTTAQKSKQAWASIKDSAISAGDELLPIVAGLMDGVANLADAFGKLPGPVKSGATAVAGVGGASLIAAAGVIKFAGFVRDAQIALAEMSLSGSKAKGIIAGVGKAAGVAALAYGATAVGEGIAARNRKEMSQLTKDLEKLGKSGKWAGELEKIFGSGGQGVSKWIGPLESFGDALEDVVSHGEDGTGWVGLNQFKQIFTAGNAGYVYNQVNTIKEMDSALSQLARNKPDEAIKAYEQLRDRALETGGSIENFSASFPAMTEVVRGASEAMGGTSDASEILEGNLQELAPAAQASAEEMQKLREQAAGEASAFRDFGAAVRDSGGNVNSFINQLEKQNKALRDFTENAVTAGKKGLEQGLIDQLRSMGPEGAQILANFANASKGEIAKANEAFLTGEGYVMDYIELFGTVPEWVSTDARFNDATARAKLNAWKRDVRSANVIAELHGRNANGGIYQYADGGFDDRGNRVPRVPQMRSGSQGTVMWGEPETGWEAYISGKPGMEERNRAIAAMAVERLGGVVAFANGGVTADSKLDYLRLQQRVRDLRKDLQAKEKYTVGKGKSKKTRRRNVLRGLDRQIAREELNEAKAELAEQKKIRKQIGKGKKYSSVAAYNEAQDFAKDFQLDKLSSPAAVERHLKRRLGEMAEFTSVLGNLKGRGASPWLLNELVRLGPSKGTIRLGKQYLSDHQALLRVNALAAQAQDVSAVFGSMTTHANWNKAGAANVITADRQNQLSQAVAQAVKIAISQVQLNLNVDGRQAGIINQAGSNFAGAYS